MAKSELLKPVLQTLDLAYRLRLNSSSVIVHTEKAIVGLSAVQQVDIVS